MVEIGIRSLAIKSRTSENTIPRCLQKTKMEIMHRASSPATFNEGYTVCSTYLISRFLFIIAQTKEFPTMFIMTSMMSNVVRAADSDMTKEYQCL